MMTVTGVLFIASGATEGMFGVAAITVVVIVNISAFVFVVVIVVTHIALCAFTAHYQTLGRLTVKLAAVTCYREMPAFIYYVAAVIEPRHDVASPIGEFEQLCAVKFIAAIAILYVVVFECLHQFVQAVRVAVSTAINLF